MFGFAPPIQHRLPPGAQTAALAMQQAQAPDAAAVAKPQSPAAALPPLTPVKPTGGQATMMPDTTLPTLVPPTLPQGTGIEDPSAALPALPTGAEGMSAAGGNGMAIADLLAELFG
jgi:hypothetical protein